MKSIQFILAAAVLCIAPSHQQAQQSTKCMDDFSTALMGCLSEAGVTSEHFMHFVTNGTSPRGQAPPNADSFKTQVCSAQQKIMACTFQRVGPVINSTACVGNSQQTNQQAAVGSRLDSIFSTYDQKCMHPCRASLPNDLRNCYTESKLDPALFLSNSSNGAVIGSTIEQVTSFCGAKDALIKCLQSKADACPEAPQIMRAIDLDIPSFQKGVTVLCNHSEIYLHGLKCFAETTPDIELCKQKDQQSFIRMDAQARSGNWSEERSIQEACVISLDQIKCDLDAWTKKNHEACTEAVIGLRRELECELVPDVCNDPKQISQVEHVCHPERFGVQARNDFNKGAASGSAWVKAGVMVTTVSLISTTV